MKMEDASAFELAPKKFFGAEVNTTLDCILHLYPKKADHSFILPSLFYRQFVSFLQMSGELGKRNC